MSAFDGRAFAIVIAIVVIVAWLLSRRPITSIQIGDRVNLPAYTGEWMVVRVYSTVTGDHMADLLSIEDGWTASANVSVLRPIRRAA